VGADTGINDRSGGDSDLRNDLAAAKMEACQS
jgi:hypothetical protein